jgi:hypothetical protein
MGEFQHTPEQVQQDPPKKRLYQKLNGKGLYSKSYEEFEKQFSTPESIGKLHNVLKGKGLYSKTADDFTAQFFGQDPEQPQPKPQPQPKTASADMMSGVSTVEYPSLDQYNAEPKKTKKEEAQGVLTGVWSKAADYARELLHERNKSAETEQRMNLGVDNTAVSKKSRLLDIVQKQEDQRKKQSIPQEEIDAFVNDEKASRAIIKKAIVEEKKAGNNDKANKIAASMYVVDADGRDAKKVEKNAKDIEAGKVKYNLQTGELYKTVSPAEAIAHGFKSRNKEYEDGYKLASMSDEEAVKYLNEELSKYDPDEPIPVPGTISEMIGSEGMMIGKGILGAVAGGVVTGGNPVGAGVGATAMTSDEVLSRTFSAETKRTYTQMRETLKGQHPDWTQEQVDLEAIKMAKEQASKAALIDGGVNAALSFSVVKQLKPASFKLSKNAWKATNQAIGATGKFIKSTAPEAALNTGVVVGAQGLKNQLANEAGIKRDNTEGVGESAEMMLKMYYGMAGGMRLAGAAGSAAKLARKEALHQFSKQPIEALKAMSDELVQDGVVMPDEAQQFLNDVAWQKNFESQFPNVKELSTLEKLEKKIDQHNELKAKVAKPEEGGVHESLHKSIKNEIKENEWEISMLAAKPEDQVKIIKFKIDELQAELDAHRDAKAEGKPGKLEDAAATSRKVKELDKQLQEVQDKLDSPLYKAEKMIDEDLKDGYAVWTGVDIYASMAKSDPEGFLTFIAEQAQGELNGVSSRQETVSAFGKELVKAAEEFVASKQPKPEETVTATAKPDEVIPPANTEFAPKTEAQAEAVNPIEEKYVSKVHERASSIELTAEFVSDKEILAKSSEPRRVRAKHNKLKKQLDILNKLVKCK